MIRHCESISTQAKTVGNPWEHAVHEVPALSAVVDLVRPTSTEAEAAVLSLTLQVLQVNKGNGTETCLHGLDGELDTAIKKLDKPMRTRVAVHQTRLRMQGMQEPDKKRKATDQEGD